MEEMAAGATEAAALVAEATAAAATAEDPQVEADTEAEALEGALEGAREAGATAEGAPTAAACARMIHDPRVACSSTHRSSSSSGCSTRQSPCTSLAPHTPHSTPQCQY